MPRISPSFPPFLPASPRRGFLADLADDAKTKRACSSKTWENMPALQVLLLRIRLLAAIVGTSLVNLKKQNGPISVLVFTERAASKELMIMCNCDHNAIIVQVLGKVVKFLLAILLLGWPMSAF